MMSRLLDRILTSCQPFKISMLFDQPFDKYFQNGIDSGEDEATARANAFRALELEPTAAEDAPRTNLENIPVITADDVAQYFYAIGRGLNVSDLVASMAPPFDEFFIEFQRIPSSGWEGNAWGVYFSVVSDPAEIAKRHPTDRPRWILDADTYLERRKGKPFGPVAHHLIGLAEDGTWFRHDDGNVYWGGGLVRMSAEPPEEVNQEWGDQIAQLIFPALMTISFMHCKNVELNAIKPPEKLSRRHQRVHGRQLVSYSELKINPIRQILEAQRLGAGGSLRKALHLCRGHFKTFSADAPLLGRATGTFWWAPQVRGAHGAGIALKDYRVQAPTPVGQAYIDAKEDVRNAEREAPLSRDPDSAGRGLTAHNRTQNYLADIIRAIGWLARSPTASEPQYDLAWVAHDLLYVCEVKSLTKDNEERQLRMAMGQIIRYRQQLTARGHEPCFAVVCTERQPADLSWDELCKDEGIILVWPEVAMARLKDAHTRHLN
jgi:hypothetical protein